MKKFISIVDTVTDKIVFIQQQLANLLLLFIMVLISMDVLGRNLFNKPLQGSYEVTELSSALLVFFALAVTHKVNDHITIDFVMTKFSERVQQIVYGFVELVITIVLFFMAKQVYGNGVRMMNSGVTTTDLGIPIYPALFIITFAIIVFAFVSIMKMLKHWGLAVERHES
ncbi:TRAP transporter small permease [Savagea sp. SN6]|uniref:TRAP transporter small permease n=1 Tax=Savagea serpentis TaxID=2785297 RepID=A0A8J7KCA0_9BACL|nr:TRAP transporter small permease [Savagea serpentis]MBF4501217.1 TRAP transporter small permease [Savagea serpentis]